MKNLVIAVMLATMATTASASTIIEDGISATINGVVCSAKVGMTKECKFLKKNIDDILRKLAPKNDTKKEQQRKCKKLTSLRIPGAPKLC